MIEIDPSILSSIADDNDEHEVQNTALDANYIKTPLMDATTHIAKLLLLRWPNLNFAEPDIPNKTNTLYEQWIEKLRADGLHSKARLLVSWVMTFRDHHSLYPTYLYNRNEWKTHDFFNYVLFSKHSPPYMPILYYNVFRQALGITHTELHHMSQGLFAAFAPLYNYLMMTDTLQKWHAGKKLSLRFYGGQTNTTLGLYDSLFYNAATGMQHFNIDADARYDVGGGFSTSEINRNLKRDFVSADIRGPSIREYDEDMIIRAINRDNPESFFIADDEQRTAFLDRQDKVAWLPFDVFKDHFPDAQSYAFISTGFMTSTVRANLREVRAPLHNTGLSVLSTSFHGLMRIMEKVAEGKDVDLFTVQRASGRIYKYKTVFLQWRRGRLIRLVTTDDEKHGRRWTPEAIGKIYRSMDPNNDMYPDYLKLRFG